MNAFKVELVKPQPFPSSAPFLKPPPKLAINIESIVCLNYPIETLIQVLSAHFDEEPCAAGLVVKALKVVSISLKDKELRGAIENILAENMHKRHKVYLLFLYWSSISLNVMPTLQKLQQKLVHSMLGCAISQYLFTPGPYSMQISQSITLALRALPPEAYSKVCQHVKNEFMSMNYPFRCFVDSGGKFRGKEEKIWEFLGEIGNSIVKAKQSEDGLRDMLKDYFKDTDLRSRINNFFTSFPSLIPYFVSNLCPVLQKQEVLQIWSTCDQNPMEQPIRSSIKEWISTKQNYWSIFQLNFSKRSQEGLQKWNHLLQLGYQLDEETIVSQFLVKQYLYNYFSEIDFDADLESKSLQSVISNKDKFRQIHSIGDTISDMIKSFGNVHKEGGVSLVVLNKVHAFSDWPKTNLQALAACHPLMDPFIQNLKGIVAKLQKKVNEKGQKIQLAYHVIRVSILSQDKMNRKWALLTFAQLSTILKTNKLQKDITFMDEFHPTGTQAKKEEPKKQIHSIVVESKIVRVMKREKNKINFGQICEEVVKEVNVPEESVRLALDKVVAKGLVNVQPQGLYSYCP